MRVDSFDKPATIPAGRRTTFGLTIDDLWRGLPVFALLWKMFMFRLPVLDFWWHLKMGQVIATTKSIPRVDLFSFTAAGRPFIAQNWLAELIFYGTYRIGGLALLVFLNAMVALAGFALVYQLCLKATDNVRIAAFFGFLAAAGNYTFSRPQAFSFLMFSAFSFILCQYRESRCGYIWCLPVLTLFWVNLHGAFVLGLGLILLYICTESCRRLVDPSRNDALSFADIRRLVLIL